MIFQIKNSFLITSLLIIVSGLLLSYQAQAVDIEAGKVKAEQVCASCHGIDGIAILPTYPKLTGQYADYLIHSLKAYRSGDRTNPIMAGFAATLSDQDIENLAHYYSSLKDKRLATLDIK